MTNRVIKYRGKNLTDYYVFLSLWLAGHHRQGRSRYKYKTVGNNSAMTVVTPCLSRTTGVIARSANQRRLWPGCWPVIGWRWLQVESMFIINVGVTMVPATWTHTEQADGRLPTHGHQTLHTRHRGSGEDDTRLWTME